MKLTKKYPENSTGIARRIDNLGRIVLPMELRHRLGISENDLIEFFFENNAIVLRKYQNSCIFCGTTDNISSFKGKKVCTKCLEDLKSR